MNVWFSLDKKRTFFLKKNPRNECLDEFKPEGEDSTPKLHWKAENNRQVSDCDVVVNGGVQTFHIHLIAAVCSSNYFFSTVLKNVNMDESNQTGRTDDTSSKLASSAGDLQLKTRDGKAFKAGSVSGTVLALKQQVQEFLGISESQQRLFHRDDQGRERELDEDWRTLGGSGMKRGDTVLVVAREAWQRWDAASRTVHSANRPTQPPSCHRHTSRPRPKLEKINRT